mgnify:FL=1
MLKKNYENPALSIEEMNLVEVILTSKVIDYEDDVKDVINW